MPSLPDIPGKGLIEATTKRGRVLAGVAGAGALAAGGLIAKKVLGHGGSEKVDADPIAETPTAPPGAEEKPVPKAKPAEPKPKAAKPKPAKPAEPKPAKAEKPKPPKPPKPKAEKPAKPKAAPKSKPATTTGTDAPPKPDSEPGNISTDREHPHRALNNPVVDPDETEYPDPFEKRPDPRDPADPDGEPFGEEPHPQVGSESTSEPPPSQDPEVGDRAKPPKRDKLDD
jgi:hypothetical protein